jgi:protein-disulfide isomerase
VPGELTLDSLDTWEDDTVDVLRIGRADAAVTIIELMDFECPFCKQLAEATHEIQRELGDDVTIVVHHLPLKVHQHALAAAVAAECADEQDRFAEFYRIVFGNQKSLGRVPWNHFAEEAGIPDLNRFKECQERSHESFPRIARGLEFAKRIGARGTPTVVVNGQRLSRPPTLDELRLLVTSWTKPKRTM